MKTIQQHFNNAKSKTLLTITLGLGLAIAANAQPGPPPPPPGPQPGVGLQTVNTYQGKVVKMASNDDYVYDGFYMVNNGDSLLVKFPPHLGAQVTASIKTGTTVSVSGVLNIAPRGEKEIRMISITSGSKTIEDTGAPANDTPPAETYVSGSGKVTQLQTNREGDVNGVIIDSKTILRVPPHIARQLGNGLAANATIAFTGMQKPAGNGESMAADYKVIHCRTITINGQQYAVE